MFKKCKKKKRKKGRLRWKEQWTLSDLQFLHCLLGNDYTGHLRPKGYGPQKLRPYLIKWLSSKSSNLERRLEDVRFPSELREYSEAIKKAMEFYKKGPVWRLEGQNRSDIRKAFTEGEYNVTLGPAGRDESWNHNERLQWVDLIEKKTKNFWIY